MRYSVFAAVLISACIGIITASCDLLNKDVLIDDGEKPIVTDSTTIRLMSSVPDSTHLVIETTADWQADVTKGGEWCSLSKHNGVKGKDTIFVHVDENTETVARQTFIRIEAGNLIMMFKVTQMAAESWFDSPYWSRTATERLGLHGNVEQITVTDNRHTTESSIYTFDSRGNLLSNKSIDKVAEKYDTTRTYTYDQDNHRLTCVVLEDANKTEVRNWQYEYKNNGKFVAYSAKGWIDPDPLAEDMEGMIVPDLSAAHKTWTENGVKFHEDRTYTFESNIKLIITVDRWKERQRDSVHLGSDTMRVTYQYFNSSNMYLPTVGSHLVNDKADVTYVSQSTYNSNGMLKMMVAKDFKYIFYENDQRMIVSSFEYMGNPETPHEIDSYECEYNSNRDLTVRRIYYKGDSGITVESYPQYQYDDQHNWTARVEEILRPEYKEPIQYATKRDFVYYVNK